MWSVEGEGIRYFISSVIGTWKVTFHGRKVIHWFSSGFSCINNRILILVLSTGAFVERIEGACKPEWPLN